MTMPDAIDGDPPAGRSRGCPSDHAGLQHRGVLPVGRRDPRARSLTHFPDAPHHVRARALAAGDRGHVAGRRGRRACAPRLGARAAAPSRRGDVRLSGPGAGQALRRSCGQLGGLARLDVAFFSLRTRVRTGAPHRLPAESPSDAEHVPRTGPAILAANHASFLDPILISIPAKRPVRFLVVEPVLPGSAAPRPASVARHDSRRRGRRGSCGHSGGSPR